jgi:hypothetical protein
MNQLSKTIGWPLTSRHLDRRRIEHGAQNTDVSADRLRQGK